MTGEEDICIVVTAAAKLGTSPQAVKETISLTTLISTVKRRLAEASSKRRIVAQKPLLRTQNNVKRLQFTQHHPVGTAEERNLIVFTDECHCTTKWEQNV
ncbi:hypothetical protein HPB49_018799 [Dermacentor silvarum]|uniref:Uncharacterized protein n=1 Tax=Dermacentor silvarum TaxID=543639 RepID=A0ACB8CGV6_DERSI|nr:hypothetical protein HPB49_018799 [Dermacentor silvarum]